VRFPQFGIQARFAQGARFAALALRKVMATAGAVEFGSDESVALGIDFGWNCLRTAPDALFADDSPALCANADHR
jgi:hypothetical protein